MGRCRRLPRRGLWISVSHKGMTSSALRTRCRNKDWRQNYCQPTSRRQAIPAAQALFGFLCFSHLVSKSSINGPNASRNGNSLEPQAQFRGSAPLLIRASLPKPSAGLFRISSKRVCRGRNTPAGITVPTPATAFFALIVSHASNQGVVCPFAVRSLVSI